MLRKVMNPADSTLCRVISKSRATFGQRSGHPRTESLAINAISQAIKQYGGNGCALPSHLPIDDMFSSPPALPGLQASLERMLWRTPSKAGSASEQGS
jgi:hypothetical protein